MIYAKNQIMAASVNIIGNASFSLLSATTMMDDDSLIPLSLTRCATIPAV
jgi:hypothetical protein